MKVSEEYAQENFLEKWSHTWQWIMASQICLDKSDIIKGVKARRLRWLGHIFQTNETQSHRKWTFSKPEGPRRRRRQKTWL